jgi:hypothetical protein
MERPSFGTRARQRILSDTVASIKGRVIPLGIGAIGLMLTYLINLLWLHLNTAKQLAVLTTVSLGGSYAIWFLCVLIVNTLRVPWLLDAESNVLITHQEKRAEVAENNLAEIRAAREKQDDFGLLTQQGANFLSQINLCRAAEGIDGFDSWDRHSNEWIKSVQQAMRDMGFPTDAVEFVRAGEYAEPVKGVVNTGLEQEKRRRVLKKHQEYLANFVRQRLS